MKTDQNETDSEFDLRRLIEVVTRRIVLVAAVPVLTLLAAFAWISVTVPVFRASSLVLIEKEQRGGKDYGEGSLAETSADDYYQTQYRLIKSRSLLRAVYEKQDLAASSEFAGEAGFEALCGAVSAQPIPRSRLVNIAVEARDPVLATRLANAVSEGYVQQNIENKLFISKEILRALKGKGQGEVDRHSLPAVVNNPLIQQLKGNLAKLETRAGELSNRYTAEHPERRRLDSETSALRRRIDEESARVLEGMKAELSGQMLGNNVRIVDPAEVPKTPWKPRKTRAFGLALLLGLLLGLLAAVAAENLDQSLHSQDEVERRLQLPFLGPVPRSEPLALATVDQYRALLAGPESVTGEAVKSLRTMISLAAAGKPYKRILLTSTVQGEGKTFLAINLALAYAQLGENVLLIEGDLRRPNLHRKFGLSRAAGLSTFLAEAATPQEAASLLQDTSDPKLKVLVCGPIPPNPAELLSTPRLKSLLSWAGDRFDRVIIDGTPLFPVTDSLLWGEQLDAVLLVVQFGGVSAKLAAKAVQKLREARLPLLGAALNQVTRSAGTYGDYYAYGERYYREAASDRES